MSDDPGLSETAATPLDPWHSLRRFTNARIALGRSGVSLPTRELLPFGWAHAQARDAVHRPLDVAVLLARLRDAGAMAPTDEALVLASQAGDRQHYLLRPDLGRRLDEQSRALLKSHAGAEPDRRDDVVFVIADGLSAQAALHQAAPLLGRLIARLAGDHRIAPLVVATQGRVALGDEVGELLGARLVVMLLGERPGLSSPHSLGVYLTHAPRVGTPDSARNCVSNIHAGGLSTDQAAHRLDWLIRAALARGLTGVSLKDDSIAPVSITTATPASMPAVAGPDRRPDCA